MKVFTGYVDNDGNDVYKNDVMDVNNSCYSGIVGVVDLIQGKWTLVQSDGREDLLENAIDAGYTVVGNLEDNPSLIENYFLD